MHASLNPSQPLGQKPTPSSALSVGGTGTILVIDDNPADIRLLAQLLRDEGYLIIAAQGGEQGIALALQKQPDLVLLDWYMPGMDGPTTCRRMKSDPRLAALPIIFLTASNALDDKLQGFALGAVDYITKPFAIKEVSARLRVHLRISRERVSGALAPEPPSHVAGGARDAQPVSSPSTQWISTGELLVRKAQAHILADLAQSPSLTELAHAIGTNERRLTHEFRRYTGFAVFEYMREERHRRACELLLHSQTPINLIAEQVGYQAIAAFTYAFRRRFGVTPTEYRQSAGVAASPAPAADAFPGTP